MDIKKNSKQFVANIISEREDPFIRQTLKENEQRANNLCSIVFIVVMLANLSSFTLTKLGLFTLSEINSVTMGEVAIMGIVVALNKFSKLSSNTLKFINIGILLLISAGLDMAANYNVTLVIVIPIIVSCLYFDSLTVAIISLATVVVFAVETYISAKMLILIDNNHIVIPKGTQLNIRTTLKDAILDSGIDAQSYAEHMMTMGYIPKLLTLSIIIAAAMAVAHYGKSMLLRQANVTAEHTRIDTELAVANALQANALPTVDDLNGRYNFELAASMKAARETGGDFYDFMMLDDRHLAIVIADVSDKGVPAAMFMMSSKARLNSALSLDRSPAEILSEVNNSLCTNNSEEMFVTVWLGILNLETGILTSANAGHEDPIIGSCQTGFAEIKEQHGMFLGIFEGLKYKENQHKLKSGDLLILYTDGVTEANNSERELYGMKRFIEDLNEKGSTDSSADEIMKLISSNIRAFAGNTEQSDDITMLVLKMK